MWTLWCDCWNTLGKCSRYGYKDPLKPTLSIMQATCKSEQQLKDSVIMATDNSSMAFISFFSQWVWLGNVFCHWRIRCVRKKMCRVVMNNFKGVIMSNVRNGVWIPACIFIVKKNKWVSAWQLRDSCCDSCGLTRDKFRIPVSKSREFLCGQSRIPWFSNY